MQYGLRGESHIKLDFNQSSSGFHGINSNGGTQDLVYEMPNYNHYTELYYVTTNASPFLESRDFER